ncbi:NCS2 family permease [Clostridium fungisolvens]|uniref:Guanine/hypoxanthine permease PbuG n=1 Tax=Clostridium fungisolvens TaxID=1604897 RepID=A0A6V8SCJ6_9CLOT|nr:NCS2 family permease [Clostridium fungisolvens]GFP74959.1 Guanine/hypoxanthine permease PbuG [Clostridium fungisolvens]
MNNLLEKLFKLKENDTDVKTELLGGLTSFITVAYALLVIPNILKMSGMNLAGLKGDAAAKLLISNDPIVASAFASTCLAAAIGTLIMAFRANLPFILAPGLGLVSFFSFNVCLNLGYTWQQGLAAVFISGLVFVLITVTSIREKIVMALPENIKLAITAGIGLFISLIGLKSGGVIVANPATLMAFGDFTNKATILTIIGVLIIAVLMARKVKGAILIGIVVTTLIGIPMGVTTIDTSTKIFSMPTIGATFFALDFKGLLSHNGSGVIGAFLSVAMVVITLSLVDLFDSIGTLVGTAGRAGMVDKEGNVKNLRKALESDAIATTIGGLLGTTTISTVVESASGISEGARTGLANIVPGVLFIVSMFFSGVVGIIPSSATSPALIIVGVLMLSAVKDIDFSDFTEAVPVFFTIAMMPFTYSIANGIAVGLIFYPLMKVLNGRHKEVHPILYVFAVLFIVRFVLLPG